MITIPAEDPLAVQVVEAIRSGDLEALQALLREHPDLAGVRIVETGSDNRRSSLHVAATAQGAETVVEWLRERNARTQAELG